jgi:hypothetical protein
MLKSYADNDNGKVGFARHANAEEKEKRHDTYIYML